MEATVSGEKFDPKAVCASPSVFKVWTTYEFAQTSKVYSLPNGINAAAFCLVVPSGATAMEIHGGSKGGMTYFETTAVRPSVLFLDQDYKPVVDLQRPRMRAAEGLFSGFGVSGMIPFSGRFAPSAYAVVYIHPLSTNGSISVRAGYDTIPVPYGPYGSVKARFLD